MRFFSSILILALLAVGAFQFTAQESSSVDKSIFLHPLPEVWIGHNFKAWNSLPEATQVQKYQERVLVLKNQTACLPLGRLDQKLACISLGGNSSAFTETLNTYADRMAFFESDTLKIKGACQKFYKLTEAQTCIVSLHPKHPHALHIDKWALAEVPELQANNTNILVLFGDQHQLEHIDTTKFDAIILAHENHRIAQEQVAQLIMGGLSAAGLTTNGRLGMALPEQLGINSADLKQIDAIAEKGITAGAYPGCQVLVAVEDHIIWHKAYGKQGYESNSPAITKQSLYDIASVTKIAASTLLAMQQHSKGTFDLDRSIGSYVPELTDKTPFGELKLREIMAHQAGLTPWIPFYKRSLTNGQWNPAIYSSQAHDLFTLEVAKNMYMHSGYKDSMYAQIMRSELGPKKYVYSDLCYYFTQPILEKVIGENQASYLRREIYIPLGLNRILYHPLRQFNESEIVPTEDDQAFRKQLLRGYVHDPGAAMLGGAAGHAGIFANAYSLASIMQLFLNKGQMAGMRVFSEASYQEFTKQQYPGNRRAAGFDRPNASGGGTCDELASQQSFGHSGFTGTLAWADPKNKVIFIFLSNRVHPSQDNWKLRDLNIRTDMQHVVYEAIQKRKN
ncbi:MAG: hypothetical protein RLZZ301_1604 [Bacteroidota bacterium]|jgi:CubicO group peptidase (beta-lactamase class C family)